MNEEQNSESQQEQIMAARREARRRRILDNSAKRLGKISGKEIKDDDDIKSKQETSNNTEKIVYPDPEFERDVLEDQYFTSMFNRENDTDNVTGRRGNATIEEDLIRNLISNLGQNSTSNGPQLFAQFQAFQNGEVPLFGSSQVNSNPNTRKSVETSKLLKTLRTKIQFAIIAIITYFLVATNQSVVMPNCFLLFLMWEIVEVFLMKTYESSGQSFLGLIFLLGGIPKIHSRAIIQILETINKILKDVAVFLFAFVFIHIIWQTIMFGNDARFQGGKSIQK